MDPEFRYPFKHKPFQHQLDCLLKSWSAPSFALFCEMGTGKTKILIDNIAMLYDKGEINGALILAPKGVYRNWVKELSEHMPTHVDYKTAVWSPNLTQLKVTELVQILKPGEHLKILLMNIEALSTDKGISMAEKFLAKNRTFMAIDESTAIKSYNSIRTKWAVKLGKRAKYRRIATGSPVTNGPLDLFSQCEFLDPKLLGFFSFFTFKNYYCEMWKRPRGDGKFFDEIIGFRHMGELAKDLSKFSYRVRKEDCLDLPPKVYIKREVELTPEQKRAYDSMLKHNLAIIDGNLSSVTIALTQLMRLMQICSGHLKMDDGQMSEFGTRKLDELMQCIDETDGKVIIWAHFTHDILAICKELEKKYGKGSVAAYHGATSDDRRPEIVRDFQDPNGKLRFFVGQQSTGGYGITLTAASTVIYYSNNYALEQRLQSEDRAHRIGQNKSVTYVDIVTTGTVEEKVREALIEKLDIANIILKEEGRAWLR